MMTNPDIDAAAAFLSELDPESEQFTFQTFDDSPDKRKALAKVLHGTLAECFAQLSSLNQQGAGVFVTVNETDLKGRAKGNIVRVRSLFVDHDTADPDRLQTLAGKLEQWPPSCIVESSPGKHHFYWWADLPLTEFSDTLARLIEWQGSDPAVKDLPRVMRLPGFYHQKGAPFRVRMIHQSGERYTAEQVRQHLDAIAPASIAQDAHSAPVSAPVLPMNRYAQRAIERATQAILTAPEGERNDTLNSEAFGLFGLVKGGHLPEQETRQTIIRAASGAGLPDAEVLTTLDSAWSAAQPREIDARPVTLLADQEGNAAANDEVLPSWPELADPFTEYVVPAFPLEVLPEAWQSFACEMSAQSGFDAGGYAICLLIAAGNTVDHRQKLNLGPFRVPAYNWAGLVGDSGQGKSPVMRTSTAAVCRINDELVAESRQALGKWLDACSTAKKEKTDPPPKPLWKQRHALDTTTEALAQLLEDNPEGVNLYHDEITEFLGRMDAYSGKDGGKDRGVFLRSYDGGQVTINRASKLPQVVENFSIGIIAGIQPEVLAKKFKQSGAGADGLYQRFLMYCLRPAGDVNYSRQLGPHVKANADRIFITIQKWNEEGVQVYAELSREARQAMERYHNDARRLARRTAASRFAEHIDKFPGFLGRIAYALHIVHAAASGHSPSRTLEADTMEKAIALMRVLYRHSEAVYSVLDAQSGEVQALVKSAAEAILCKRWERFRRGDLTRNATGWRGADYQQAESAIDYLIELGWIADVTPPPIAGKRGRKSDGLFQVNPDVHCTFVEHAERITQTRAERYKALQSMASDRE